jgi:1,4-dihydroxy-2-naphthoate octaprenyltransferase
MGGLVLYLLGVTMALYSGASLDLTILIWGQIAVTSVQIMTHYGNDYFDLAADRANPTPTRWSGGSGILPAGHVAPVMALVTAIAAGLLALGVSLWLALALSSGPLALPLLLLALLLAWTYSAPPLQLHSTGFGELAASVLITGLTPLVGFYLQAGRLMLLPLLAVIPLIILQFIMLVLIEFPDAQGDAAVGKYTLVVRLGPQRAARLLQAVILIFLILLPLLTFAGLPRLAFAVLALFNAPALVWLFYRLRQGLWAHPGWWNWLGFTGIALVMGSALVELAAFVALWAVH